MNSVYEKYEDMSLGELKKASKVARANYKKFHRPEDNLLLIYLGHLIAVHETKAAGTVVEYWDGRDSKLHPDARFSAPEWYSHRYRANKARRKLDGDITVSFDEPALQYRANECALIPLEERQPSQTPKFTRE